MRLRLRVSLAMMVSTALLRAAPPLEIDDADPAEPGDIEIELGSAYRREGGFDHWDFPIGVNYGIYHNWELNMGLGGLFEERYRTVSESGKARKHRVHGIGDLTAGAKWRFWSQCPLGARHTLKPEIKFPTADKDKDLGSGKMDYDLTWVVSRRIGENTDLHFNLGYLLLGDNEGDVIHYGVAMEYEFLEGVQWVGEVFTEQDAHHDEDPVLRFNTGLRWAPRENLTLDCAAGSRIHGDAPDLSMRIGLQLVL